MLRETEPAPIKIFIWSDKKMSTVEAVTIKQSEGVYAVSSGNSPVNVGRQFRCKKPVCDMVWAAVASDLRKSCLGLIDEGLKVNSQVYLNMLHKKGSSLAQRNFWELIILQTGRHFSSHSDPWSFGCQWSGAEPNREGFRTCKWGHPQAMILFPWTLLSGLFWRGMFQLDTTPIRTPWRQSFNQFGPRWMKK